MTRSLAILTTLALVLAACGSTPVSGTTGGAASATPGAAKPIYGGTVTFGLENDVSNLDPMLSGLFVDRNIHYSEGRHHPVARGELEVQRRREERHLHAPQGREVPRRLGVRRRCREMEHRPLHPDQGLEPHRGPRFGRQRLGRRRIDGALQPQGRVLAATRCARRPCRHDGLAQGRRSHGRGLHAQAVQGRDRPVHPHRSREERPLHPREEPGLVGH